MLQMIFIGHFSYWKSASWAE